MNTIIISLFISIILVFELSIAFRIKNAFKIDQFKYIKILQCFPCFTWWISIIVIILTTGNIIESMATFVIASIIDKLWN